MEILIKIAQNCRKKLVSGKKMGKMGKKLAKNGKKMELWRKSLGESLGHEMVRKLGRNFKNITKRKKYTWEKDENLN